MADPDRGRAGEPDPTQAPEPEDPEARNPRPWAEEPRRTRSAERDLSAGAELAPKRNYRYPLGLKKWEPLPKDRLGALRLARFQGIHRQPRHHRGSDRLRPDAARGRQRDRRLPGLARPAPGRRAREPDAWTRTGPPLALTRPRAVAADAAPAAAAVAAAAGARHAAAAARAARARRARRRRPSPRAAASPGSAAGVVTPGAPVPPGAAPAASRRPAAAPGLPERGPGRDRRRSAAPPRPSPARLGETVGQVNPRARQHRHRDRREPLEAGPGPRPAGTSAAPVAG